MAKEKILIESGNGYMLVNGKLLMAPCDANGECPMENFDLELDAVMESEEFPREEITRITGLLVNSQ